MRFDVEGVNFSSSLFNHGGPRWYPNLTLTKKKEFV